MHGHDNVSIRMLKVYGDLICKPLEMIFCQDLVTDMFPFEWKIVIGKILKDTVLFLYLRFVE